MSQILANELRMGHFSVARGMLRRANLTKGALFIMCVGLLKMGAGTKIFHLF